MGKNRKNAGGSTYTDGNNPSIDYSKEIKLDNVIYALKHPKDAAYAMMIDPSSYSDHVGENESQAEPTFGSSRSWEDIKLALNNIPYIVSRRGNIPRNLASLYIYGNDQNQFEELPHFNRFDDRIREQGRDLSSIKTYKGNIDPHDFGQYIFPEDLQSAIEQYAINQEYGNVAEYGFGDDVAAYAIYPGYNRNGDFVMNYADYWDFDKNYSKKYDSRGEHYDISPLVGLEAKALDKVGTPFILVDERPVKYTDWDEVFDNYYFLPQAGKDILRHVGVSEPIVITPSRKQGGRLIPRKRYIK